MNCTVCWVKLKTKRTEKQLKTIYMCIKTKKRISVKFVKTKITQIPLNGSSPCTNFHCLSKWNSRTVGWWWLFGAPSPTDRITTWRGCGCSCARAPSTSHRWSSIFATCSSASEQPFSALRSYSPNRPECDILYLHKACTSMYQQIVLCWLSVLCFIYASLSKRAFATFERTRLISGSGLLNHIHMWYLWYFLL